MFLYSFKLFFYAIIIVCAIYGFISLKKNFSPKNIKKTKKNETFTIEESDDDDDDDNINNENNNNDSMDNILNLTDNIKSGITNAVDKMKDLKLINSDLYSSKTNEKIKKIIENNINNALNEITDSLNFKKKRIIEELLLDLFPDDSDNKNKEKINDEEKIKQEHHQQQKNIKEVQEEEQDQEEKNNYIKEKEQIKQEEEEEIETEEQEEEKLKENKINNDNIKTGIKIKHFNNNHQSKKYNYHSKNKNNFINNKILKHKKFNENFILEPYSASVENFENNNCSGIMSSSCLHCELLDN